MKRADLKPDWERKDGFGGTAKADPSETEQVQEAEKPTEEAEGKKDERRK